jgi:transcriptional regulator with XRE-family HTH domain
MTISATRPGPSPTDNCQLTTVGCPPPLLGQWLERVRASRNHTWRDVSRIAGLTEGSLLSIACGIHRPARAATRAALAAYLDIDPDTVLLLADAPAEAGFRPESLTTRYRRLHAVRNRLAQELDAVREDRSHTLAQVAAIVGLASQATVMARYRKIGARMTPATASGIAAYLDVSVAQVLAWADEPAAPTACYPQPTWVGTQYHPPIEAAGCVACRFLDPCRRDVLERDGFAWCERLIPVDLDPDHATQVRSRYSQSQNPYKDEEDDEL